MRMWVVGVSVLMAMTGDALEAAPKGVKETRSVQLIVMEKAGRKELNDPSSSPSAGPPSNVESLPPQTFRVHDLSRRWVEHEMAQSLGATTQGSPLGGIGDDGPAAGPVPSLAASMPIPVWMRGGSPFASASARYVPGCASIPYRPTGFLRSDIEARRAGYYGMMSSIACEYGVPVSLFDALIIRESQYQPHVYSPKSAFGLTQLMPGTAAILGVNRYDIEGNLRGGARYLRQQLDRFGHYHLALAAYNAGPGRVRGGVVPRIAETQAYVDNVLLNWSRLSGLSRTATVTTGAAAYSPRPERPLGRTASVSTF